MNFVQNVKEKIEVNNVTRAYSVNELRSILNRKEVKDVLITYTSDMTSHFSKTNRDNGNTAGKVTTMAVNIGTAYEDIPSVKEDRENGKDIGKLAEAYEWIRFPYLLYSSKSNSYQLRVYPEITKECYRYLHHSEYTLNGEMSDKASVLNLCIPSYINKEAPKCFNIKLENITNITVLK